MGRTPAPASLGCADDVCNCLLEFADEVADAERLLLVGHSAGAYYAQGIAARRTDQIAGLALVCPLLPTTRGVPEHRPLVGSNDLGDEEFRGYFVVHTPEMLARYKRFVAPAIPLVDQAAMERIGARWEFAAPAASTYGGPTLVVAGRQDSTVGFAAAVDLLSDYPASTVAILDGAGHALPHEKPNVLAALLQDWLARVAAG